MWWWGLTNRYTQYGDAVARGVDGREGEEDDDDDGEDDESD